MDKFKNIKRLETLFVLILITIFFIHKFKLIDYGLPFFDQEDENSFLKGTISFLSYFTGIKNEITDPFFGPLINLLLTLKFLFFNEFIVNGISFSEIREKIYNDPSIMILYGRFNSLIITSLSLFLLHLIFKKLKINFYIYFPLLISLSLSIFLLSISLVNGKNSYYLIFFLIQLYFLIKYLVKLEKFDKYSYLIFSVLCSIAWGINYWSSIVSFYGILVLHYKKFKFQKFKYLLNFGLLFLIVGFLPSILMENIFFLDFFSRTNEVNNLSLYSILQNLISKFIFSLQIILNTEFFLIIFISLFIFYIFTKFENKKIVILLAILILEPIIIFSFTGSYFIPELRYFAGIICLIFILSAIIVNDFSKVYNSKLVIGIFLMINLIIIHQKFNTNLKINKIISNNHSFAKFYEKNENINKEILYLIPNLDNRKNLDNLNFYKTLHEKKIIKNKIFQKDNYVSILKKIESKKRNNKKIINKSLIDLNLFNIEIFEIIDYRLFFEEAKKNYNYVSIQENNLKKNELNKFIKSNFKKTKQHYLKNDLYYNDGLRDIIKFLYKGGSEKKLNEFILGNNYAIYDLNQ